LNYQHFLICYIFLFACSYFDIRYRRIPNRLIICAACAGAVVSGIGFIVRFVLAMAISYTISHLRVIGGGDLKMFSVIMGLTGIWGFMVIALLGSVICVCIRTLLILIKKNSRKDTFPMAPYVLMGYVCWRCLCVAS
jgi:leader peptidase (prepilin peptidase) / N-methyltransferase